MIFDYDKEYKEYFLGEIIPQEVFDSFIKKVVNRIDSITTKKFSSLEKNDDVITAVFEIADLMYNNEQINKKINTIIDLDKEIVSESVDGFSRTYQNIDIEKLKKQLLTTEEINNKIINILNLHLYYTNILFGGLDVF